MASSGSPALPNAYAIYWATLSAAFLSSKYMGQDFMLVRSANDNSNYRKTIENLLSEAIVFEDRLCASLPPEYFGALHGIVEVKENLEALCKEMRKPLLTIINGRQ